MKQSLTTHRSNRGFSALEILIVVGIITIIVWVVGGPLLKFRDHQVLVASGEQVVNALREARAQTLNSKNDRRYGVHIEKTRFVVFENTWMDGAATNKVTTFDSGVVATTTILIGGGRELLFDRLTGNPSQSGTIVLELKRDSSAQKIVTISPTGTVSIDE